MGSGDDYISINATTRQTQRRYDPAYGSKSSSIDLDSGNDRLFINANASGQGDIRAFGALDSTIDAGSGDDIVRINASASNNNNWGWGNAATATGISSTQLSTGIGDDSLSIEITAQSRQNEWSGQSSWEHTYRYSGSSRRSGEENHSNSWGYRGWYGSYSSNYGRESKYDYAHEYSNQGHHKGNESSRIVDISGGESYGAIKSNIDLGGGENTATINIVAGNQSIGFRDTSLNSGDNNDSFSLSVNANGERGYKYTRYNDYASSGYDIGNSSGKSSSWHSHQNNYRYWWWGNHQSHGENESEWDHSWNRSHEYSGNNITEHSNTHRFGSAVGTERSTIYLGNGDNTAEISVEGGERALGLTSSDLLTGSGSDTISISTNAAGITGHSYIDKGRYSNDYSNTYSYRDSNTHSHAYSSRQWYGYTQSRHEGGYDHESEGEHTNQEQSSWDTEYSRTYRFGVSIGADNSSIDAGHGDNNINLQSVGGELAIALANSSINTGDGNDYLTISGLAEGEDSYVNRSERSSRLSHDSWNSNKRHEEYSRSYTSSYYWYSLIDEYASNHESENKSFSTLRRTYNQERNNSKIKRFGIAYGARNSSINLGNGENEASISANGGDSAEALSKSSLETGKADDIISLNAVALGENSSIDKNKLFEEIDFKYNHIGEYSSQREGANQLRRWRTIGSSHAYKTKGNYENHGDNQSLMIRDYENSYVQKLGSAVGANGSTINTGGGDDLLTVNANGYTAAIGIKDSSVDLDLGDDIFTINSSAFGYTKLLRRNLGSYEYSSKYRDSRSHHGKYFHT